MATGWHNGVRVCRGCARARVCVCVCAPDAPHKAKAPTAAARCIKLHVAAGRELHVAADRALNGEPTSALTSELTNVLTGEPTTC